MNESTIVKVLDYGSENKASNFIKEDEPGLRQPVQNVRELFRLGKL